MTLTLAQKKEAYRKLPPEVQNFIMDSETTDIISSDLNEIGLTPEQSDSADSEILYAMYGLQTLSTAIDNISKLSNKKRDSLSMLESNLKMDIFDKIENYKKNYQPALEEKEVVKPQESIRSDIINKKPEINTKTFIVDKKSQLEQWTEKFFAGTEPQKMSPAEKQEIAKKIKTAIKTKSPNDLPEYVKNLPKPVQDMILAGVWSGIVGEIAKKYSLSPTQSDILTNNIVFVLTGLDTPETFLGLITSELGISRLLSEQIIQDLENRVFKYAVTFAMGRSEGRNTSNEIRSTKPEEPKNMPRTVLDIKQSQATKTPEVRPVNLPAIEKGEVAHDSKQQQVSSNKEMSKSPFDKKPIESVQEPVSAPRYAPVYKPAEEMEVKSTKNEVREEAKEVLEKKTQPTSKITYKSADSVGEIVQKPVAVPRLTGMPIDDTKSEIPSMKSEKKPSGPQSVIEDKLTSITTSMGQKDVTPPPPILSETQTEKKLEEKPVHKYAVDPYRESI